ncbi:hypothetical protein VNI00_006900 [Paramarasmius palmivorus]|uniref:Uncharacterized protein n=1 Tax=Paramarasmius palmivorus TaxID=297713 RepID=A0AAW0D982_9AGAR
MSLESGLYIIKNQGKYIGRNLAEDMSLLPKRIVTLPESVQAPRWEVEKKDDNKYILKCQKDATVQFDNLVWAALLPEPLPEKWCIEHVPHHGQNAYVILRENREQGWVVTSEEAYQQIGSKPLIVGLSEPPFYPPNEHFEFVRIDRD